MATVNAAALENELVGQMQGLASQTVLPQNHPVAQAAGGNTFCKLWPVAKAALTALQSVVGSWIAFVIGIVISAGDKACGSGGNTANS